MSDYEKHKEGYFRRAKKSYEKSRSNSAERLKRMVLEAKSRAKKRGLAFDISPEDVKWNDVCPVFSIPICITNKGRGGKDNSPALDRINNDLGYVKGNVRIISNRANKLKNTMTREECLALFENWSKT